VALAFPKNYGYSIAQISAVPGRFERIEAASPSRDRGLRAYDDALRNLLATAKT